MFWEFFSLRFVVSEEFEEDEGGTGDVKEEESTHTSFISKGSSIAHPLISICDPPWSTFLANLCLSKLLMITFGSSWPFCSFQNTRNNFPRCSSPAARWLTWLRRFLSQFYLSLLFTDLTEAVTEEALKLGEINRNQTSHNPPVGPGEPIMLHRNIFLVLF